MTLKKQQIIITTLTAFSLNSFVGGYLVPAPITTEIIEPQNIILSGYHDLTTNMNIDL
ncbi:hypothetical protein [Legionella drancourtii]|uniref:Uncharacterized protein n=1 Tax=Legionella drancourtii LLAP12 TaxID=658187 RepID=G9EPL0_9GAMM|nr:hypothetical protein [Legionella drancourtii]EHL30783.1 hypothetical protein LDG_7212 [Legionella drancourtii LLAP12]